jgi:hypothetical protein
LTYWQAVIQIVQSIQNHLWMPTKWLLNIDEHDDKRDALTVWLVSMLIANENKSLNRVEKISHCAHTVA